MPRMSQFVMGLRRSMFAAWLGILLMLLQSLATAEHLSAAAAAGGSQDGPLGFLGLCTARGLTSPQNGDAPITPHDAAGHSCALCAIYCAVGSAVLPVTFQFTALPAPEENGTVLDKTTHIGSLLWRHIFARGPPVTSFI